MSNVHVMDARGAGLTEFDKFQDMKNERLTVKTGHIGPELEFGYIMGCALEESVLIPESRHRKLQSGRKPTCS